MKLSLKSRLTADMINDIVNRRRTIKSLADELGVNAHHLGTLLPERKPVVDTSALRKVRKLYQLEVARDVLRGKKTTIQACKELHMTERTFYRRLSEVRKEKQDAVRPL